MHQVRVHQMFLNAHGWPVVAPFRYAGETAGKVTRDDVIGEYQYVNHGKAMSAAVTRSERIRLQKNGTITGAVRGTWEQSGPNQATLIVNGSRYDGVFVRQREPESARSVMTFTALSKQGVAIWGARLSQ
jgi:arabinan endo-1,5-alpha-L-arabinosidase